MEKIISLSKRRGFIYQGSEIYGGLGGTWDYGPLGIELRNNIKKDWWKRFVQNKADVYGVDASILMNAKVWEATGHVSHFSDPMVECDKCKKRFREDMVDGDKCPECKKGKLGDAKEFNMMFKTSVGAVEDSSSVSYLRPETAQGIFVNFKNIQDSFRPTLPFGMAQIGKAFRNEITPRDFIFRVREFEQMEIEYFVRKENWEDYFEYWRKECGDWVNSIGINMNKVHEIDVKGDELAHYSKKTIDFEYEYPFGQKELFGLAYRTNFDLTNHKLEYTDLDTGNKTVPHVIEPSFGIERLVLAILLDAYTEEEVAGDTRVVMKFEKHMAPVQVTVLPLMKKDGMAELAHKVFDDLKERFVCQYDITGSIGKRYRRQDEIGTPYCITVDHDSLEGNTVTLRDRDTMEQVRVKIKDLEEYLEDKFK